MSDHRYDPEEKFGSHVNLKYSMLFSVYTGSDDLVRAQNSRYTIV